MKTLETQNVCPICHAEQKPQADGTGNIFCAECGSYIGHEAVKSRRKKEEG